jgi:hypothetical protein
VGCVGSDSKSLDVILYLKKLNTQNLLQSQNSQALFVGMYRKGGCPNTRSSDTLRGGPILLSDTGAVGGSNTALCSRKLSWLSLRIAIQVGSTVCT